MVVHHNMDGTSGSVSLQTGHLYHFVHHTLTCKGGISMNQNREHLGNIVTMVSILFGPCNTFNYGVDGFQVGRVRSNVHVDHFARIGLALGCPSQVIFHITIEDGFLVILTIKLAENIFGRFSEDIGEDVQTSTMGHPHHKLLHSLVRSLFNDYVQSRNQGFTPFKRKPLLSHIFGMQETFEGYSLVQFP